MRKQNRKEKGKDSGETRNDEKWATKEGKGK